MPKWAIYTLAIAAYSLFYFLASVLRDSGKYIGWSKPRECTDLLAWLYKEVDYQEDASTRCFFTRLLGFEFEKFYKPWED